MLATVGQCRSRSTRLRAPVGQRGSKALREWSKPHSVGVGPSGCNTLANATVKGSSSGFNTNSMLARCCAKLSPTCAWTSSPGLWPISLCILIINCARASFSGISRCNEIWHSVVPSLRSRRRHHNRRYRRRHPQRAPEEWGWLESPPEHEHPRLDRGSVSPRVSLAPMRALGRGARADLAELGKLGARHPRKISSGAVGDGKRDR